MCVGVESSWARYGESEIPPKNATLSSMSQHWVSKKFLGIWYQRKITLIFYTSCFTYHHLKYEYYYHIQGRNVSQLSPHDDINE